MHGLFLNSHVAIVQASKSELHKTEKEVEQISKHFGQHGNISDYHFYDKNDEIRLIINLQEDPLKFALIELELEESPGKWVPHPEFSASDEERAKHRETYNLSPDLEELDRRVPYSLLHLPKEEESAIEERKKRLKDMARGGVILLSNKDTEDIVLVTRKPSGNKIIYEIKDQDGNHIETLTLPELKEKYNAPEKGGMESWNNIGFEETDEIPEDGEVEVKENPPLTDEEIEILRKDFPELSEEKLQALSGKPTDDQEEDSGWYERAKQEPYKEKYNKQVKENHKFKNKFDAWFSRAVEKAEKQRGKPLSPEQIKKVRDTQKDIKLREKNLDPAIYYDWEKKWEDKLKRSRDLVNTDLGVSAFTYDDLIKIGFTKKLADDLSSVPDDEPVEVLDQETGDVLNVTPSRSDTGERVYVIGGGESGEEPKAVKDDSSEIQEIKDSGLVVKSSSLDKWANSLLDIED